MTKVRAKKNLGQHFLTDKNIAGKIVESLSGKHAQDVLEIGPGMGVLTQFLLEREDLTTYVIEIDNESVDYLNENYPQLSPRILSEDFLKWRPESIFKTAFNVIGNFPYNISSQIFFHILDYKDQIPEVVGMLQKEVAERLSTGPGSKAYGILSVLLQAYYDIEYLFTVHENVFNPPPKVKSAVIRLRRNNREHLNCDEKLFKTIIKMSFNQRRKTLRNSLKTQIKNSELKENEIFNKRPEQLSVSEFEELTLLIEKQ